MELLESFKRRRKATSELVVDEILEEPAVDEIEENPHRIFQNIYKK